MIFEVFKFECRYQLKSPLFVIIGLVFALLAYLAMASENVTVGGGTGNLNLNASFTIVQTHFVFSIIAMFAVVAFVATPLTRDRELKTQEMLVATGLSERQFFVGRFAGGLLFAFLAACAAIPGTLIGTFMPWLDQERIGAFAFEPYWFSIWAVMLPAILIVGSIVASVAAITRSMIASYTTLIALILGWIVANVNTDPETIAATALADPFGAIAFGETTRYWTVFEKNELVPTLAGTMLANRVLWGGVALVALAAALLRFRFAPAEGRRRGKAGPPPTAAMRIVFPSALASVVPRFDGALVVKQFASQVRMDLRAVFKSYPFYVLLLFALFNVLNGFYLATSQLFGTPLIPVTRVMLQMIEGMYLFMTVIILVYYAGELVHRERQTAVAEYVDAMPFANGIMVLAKIAALWLIVATVLLVGMLTAILVQALNGYTNFEIPTYLFGLFVEQGAFPFLLCIAAVAVQSLVRNKFVGMLAIVVLFFALNALDSLGFEHVLYQPGTPEAPLSDMNGWGHFLEPVLTVGAYWALVMVLAGVVAHLFMRRGVVGGMAERFVEARRRFNRRVAIISAVASAVAALVGGWIFYNMNVLNTYRTVADVEELQADYEKRFKQYDRQPMPAAVAVEAEVDLFPEMRRVESRGSAVLENVHSDALDELHVGVSRLLRVNSLEVPGAELVDEDAELGFRRYRFATPLPPGAKVTMSWNLSWLNPGFEHRGGTTRVVANGTFVNNSEIMPTVGYDRGVELTDNNKRRKHGLAPVERLPKYDDADADEPGQFGTLRRSTFKVHLTTTADQYAIAPGYLQREWTEGDRRHFEYEMDAPIWPFFSFMSARYAVARDRWQDVDLEVYYHPAHAFNVERMLEASKAGLDYFTREFSPYQYRQFRIIEFPAYARFAQAFPNTIPYSESIGFIADLSKDEYIDYVYYVTAHELAHQWWGHQVVGRYAQGMTVIVETLAQYSALMVMEHAYGPEKMRRFLKYELDSYLSNRGGELIEELPLALVENQPYIHYRKGSLAMYALKDAIGESNVNLALRRFLAKYAFNEPPFPRTGDLIAEFRAVAGPEHQALITELFEKIVLWDLAVTDATAEPLGDGRYRVSLTVSAKQFEADGEGRETEVPLDATLDIGVFPRASDELGDDDLPDPLYIGRHGVHSGQSTYEFVVEGEPARVGIDPYSKRIDRNPDDNLKAVSWQTESTTSPRIVRASSGEMQG